MCLSFITKAAVDLVKATHETLESPEYDLIVQLFQLFTLEIE